MNKQDEKLTWCYKFITRSSTISRKLHCPKYDQLNSPGSVNWASETLPKFIYANKFPANLSLILLRLYLVTFSTAQERYLIDGKPTHKTVQCESVSNDPDLWRDLMLASQ